LAIEKKHIEEFLLLSAYHPVLDVRSPAEYAQAHIPGAYSLPLFSDEERKVVGTAYKQQSREVAIKIGLDYFGPKMRFIVEEAERLVRSHAYRQEGQQSVVNSNFTAADSGLGTQNSELGTPDSRLVLLHCWRGGMRSAAIAWLLDLYGFKVVALIGGYKKFRHYVIESFQYPFQFKILGGYTGSGKTEVLDQLQQKGEVVIDLENLANHKGSAFGSLGMPKQPSQEMFENLLAIALRKQKDISTPIWLEDESQRIGLTNIPQSIWSNMRKSPVYFLDIPFEQRLQYIVQWYGQQNKESMIEAIQRIQKRLGGLETKMAIEYLQQNNYTESFRILLKYYDKYYFKGLHNRSELDTILTTIPSSQVNGKENALLILQKSMVTLTNNL
jgi:tRNA 2-selenouridine synthase